MLYIIYLLLAIVLLIVILIYAYINQFAHNLNFFYKLLISFGIILFTFAIIIYPRDSYNAALEGLKTWFNIVCPSLLPFFIGSELLINLGVVGFIGTLLEPIMRPVFNVPGSGSFPFVMSITSGYPVGSKIVAELYNKKLCSRAEAQRLMSFCSTSGPLFMIGAVAIGMLGSQESGMVIVLSHYLGALTVGILFRFYKHKEKTPVKPGASTFKKAFSSLAQSFNKENRPFGLMLSDSVKNSVNALLVIGGFIVLFSVIIRLLILSGFIDLLAFILFKVLKAFGADPDLIKALSSGLFEITIGSKLVASSRTVMTQKILAICALISWSGFSIHAQVASMISNTDIKMTTYIFTKILHSITSCIFAYGLLKIWSIQGIAEAFSIFSYDSIMTNTPVGWVEQLTISCGRFAITSMTILCIASICLLFRRILSFNR